MNEIYCYKLSLTVINKGMAGNIKAVTV